MEEERSREGGRGTEGWCVIRTEWVEGPWGANGETENAGCHYDVALIPLCL